jgi:two-component system, cell cycle sensor histidine kinase and response regulator CckA
VPANAASSRRFNPAAALALAIGVGAIVLNVALARQLVRIGNDARALAETWISRSSTLASFEDGLREFRQREARLALSSIGVEREQYASTLDSIVEQNDSALATLRALDAGAADSSDTEMLRTRWSSYHALFTAAKALPGGEGSAALQAFRDREPRYQMATTSARRAQETMRAGADRVAIRSRRSTRFSAALLGASILLTLAAIAMAEVVRRSLRDREAAERRWQDLADQSVGVVWELGPTGRIRYCSKSGAELLGEDADHVTGRHVMRYILRTDRRAAFSRASDIAELARAETLRELEVRVVRADGGIRWLAVSAQPLQRADGTFDGFRGLAVDITRRAQAEKALAQGRRIEAVGTLAGGVAHDLNNVLTAVTGYAQLAQAELAAGHPAHQDLAAITSAADRGAALVRRVLQFARQRPTERKLVDVADLVHEVVQLLRPQLPPHVRVAMELPESETLVLADPTELHQVIVNIAANALHAMRTEGSTLALTVISGSESVELVVTDDGVGMSPDVLEHAIEPFFSTRDVGEGTGMGLSVAHGVLTAMNGSLSIDSTEGRGTTVRVTLPRAEFPADVGTPTAASNDVNTNSLRVLMVDDDPQVRAIVARVLELASHRVEVFAAARTALDALRLDPHRADVVLTDLTMPVMNGLEFSAALQTLSGSPPIVMCSGYLDRATSDRARTLGVVALLDKPVNSTALLAALQHAASAPRVP